MEFYCDVVDESGSGRNHCLTRAEDGPYFLQNFDHPGIVLIKDLLTEKNYLQWSTAIEIALRAKLILGFTNGKIVQLIEFDEY